MKSALAALVCLCCVAGTHAAPREVPARTVRVIVPAAPGGALDALAGLLARRVPDIRGQQLIIDHRPGPAGIAGSEMAARATPDGNTVLLVDASYAANPALYGRLSYRTPEDFSPIMVLATEPDVLVVHPSLPVMTVRELIERAGSRQRLTFASSGIGTHGHLVMELFRRKADVTIIHVPFKGADAAEASLVAGKVSMMSAALGTAIPHMKAGSLRGIAVTGAKRAAAAPEIPTVSESGVDSFVANNWYAALAPARSSPRNIDALQKDFARALTGPHAAAMLAGAGFESANVKPRDTAKFLRAEISRWIELISEAGIKGEE